jgi:hypothetical protein
MRQQIYLQDILPLENIKRDAENITINKNDSYIKAYPEFIKHFETNISILKLRRFVVANASTSYCSEKLFGSAAFFFSFHLNSK